MACFDGRDRFLAQVKTIGSRHRYFSKLSSTLIDLTLLRIAIQPGSGSCLLDDDFNPISDSLDRFFWIWDGAAAHQDLEALHQAMSVGRANHRKKPRRQLHITDSWRDDLEVEISEGWTGYGQTNGLLKSIACYGVVFERLQGEALENYILRIATTRPGVLKA